MLDEAWAGLDQAAPGALDVGVRARVAAGETVMYVDHDPARLTGEADERWQLGGGSVRIAARGDDGPAGKPAASATVLIELGGMEPGSLPHVERLAGVLRVSRPPAARDDPSWPRSSPRSRAGFS